MWKRLETLFRGLKHRSREHFSVFVTRERDGKCRRIAAPFWSYYADPFVWVKDERSWLFVEEFEYFKGRGRLCCVELDRDLRTGPPVQILDLECHASFPYLIEHEGSLYMLPETCNRRSIDLYLCEEFPGRWRPVRRLVNDIDASDSVLLWHDGRWWLFTSRREARTDPGRYLAIYFSNDLLHGDWHEHPVNAERRYYDRRFSSHRNGGAIIADGQNFLRVAQDNRHYYGEALQFMLIEELTPTSYRETPYRGSNKLAMFAQRHSPHHLSAHGGLIAWDVRDRVG